MDQKLTQEFSAFKYVTCVVRLMLWTLRFDYSDFVNYCYTYGLFMHQIYFRLSTLAALLYKARSQML